MTPSCLQVLSQVFTDPSSLEHHIIWCFPYYSFQIGSSSSGSSSYSGGSAAAELRISLYQFSHTKSRAKKRGEARVPIIPSDIIENPCIETCVQFQPASSTKHPRWWTSLTKCLEIDWYSSKNTAILFSFQQEKSRGVLHRKLFVILWFCISQEQK